MQYDTTRGTISIPSGPRECVLVKNLERYLICLSGGRASGSSISMKLIDRQFYIHQHDRLSCRFFLLFAPAKRSNFKSNKSPVVVMVSIVIGNRHLLGRGRECDSILNQCYCMGDSFATWLSCKHVSSCATNVILADGTHQD